MSRVPTEDASNRPGGAEPRPARALSSSLVGAVLLIGAACGMGIAGDLECDRGLRTGVVDACGRAADAAVPGDASVGADASVATADASVAPDASVALDAGPAPSDAGGGSDAGSIDSGVGPCDLYAAGNTPCVAAYATTRLLLSTYQGPLYQVRRKADGMVKDIGATSGGVADSAKQDAFCTGSGSCTISIIYDQSSNANHLTKAPGGSKTYGPNDDVEAVADALSTTLHGHRVYGVHVVGAPSWTSPGQVGYRNTHTKGIARDDNPESEYMVADGTYYNGSCCFDFGNAEMDAVAGGYGTMEAIYFGNCNWWDSGAGAGPWVMADLEVGVFNHDGRPQRDASNNKNAQDASLAFRFATAMVKGNSANAKNGGPFTLKGGNAQQGPLTTFWDGKYPDGYSPMHRQGGVVLGVGGDNSSGAQGNFYEGVMTVGYASAATDDAVQANVVAAGYGR